MAFGELIRLTLEGEGNYHAMYVNTGRDALVQCQSTPFSLVILDADLSDLPMPDLVYAVQKLSPGIRLILVPPNSDPQNPAVVGLPANGYLNKPFYLPDLMAIVTRALQVEEPALAVQPSAGSYAVINQPEAQKPQAPAVDNGVSGQPATKPVPPDAPAWLEDVALAAQHLTRLSLETAALASLIIRENKLWAYVGQLSQPAAEELAQIVVHYWERGNGRDLAHFVHLNATDGDYMLYATAVSKDMALAVAYDTEMPFSKIRSQASYLARSLASPPGAEPLQPAGSTTPQPVTSPREGDDSARLSSSAKLSSTDGEEPLELAGLKPLLDDVPPASPVNQTTAPVYSSQGSDSVQTQTVQPEAAQAITTSTLSTVEVPQPVAVEASLNTLEPASHILCNLSYACMMLPRMPQHSVGGDLAQRLSGWTKLICLAYGWRLDELVVNPEYVIWVVNLPPEISPSYMMRVFRQQTSARIFTDFPTLGRENPSGDFWAPGYLIMSSSQLPSDALVADFIKHARHRQGVS